MKTTLYIYHAITGAYIGTIEGTTQEHCKEAFNKSFARYIDNLEYSFNEVQA